MYDQILLPTDGDACIKLIYACQILTKQYRSVLEEVGTAYHVSENELRVLVCLSVYPEVHTQKDLQATGLPLSISSICRMTDALRKKGYLTTTLDPHDRRSWIIHLEERGSALLPGFSESKGVEPLNVGVEMNFSASAMAFSEHLRIDKTGGNTYN